VNEPGTSLHVLFAAPAYWPATAFGGPVPVMLELAAGLGAKGCTVDVVTTSLTSAGGPCSRRTRIEEHGSSTIVYAAASASVISVDAVWPDLKDLDGLKRDSEMGRALGFLGKSMVHPSHIDVVNEAFTPTAAEVEFARGLMTEFEKAVAEGKGSISYAGKLVDRPIYARAVGTVKLADRLTLGAA